MDSDFYRDNILKKLCQTYDAVYLLLPDNNEVIDYKASQKTPVIYKMDEILCYLVENNVAPDYRGLFMDYIGSPEKLANIKNISKESKIVFKSVSGAWFGLSFWPFAPEEFYLSSALLVTIREVTDIKNDFSDMFKLSRSHLSLAENYIRLFVAAASDMCTSVWKLDFKKNEFVQISIDGDMVEETHVANMNEAYKVLLDTVHPDDKDDFQFKTSPDKLEKLADGSKITVNYRRKEEGGGYHWYSAKIIISSGKSSQVKIEEGGEVRDIVYSGASEKTATIFLTDVNNEFKEKSELLSQSEHDELTGLFNRTKLDSMRKKEYAELDSCGIFFFDVNNLKPTNDKYGHEAGDNLLCLAADSVRSLQNRRVHAYRYGGDEFIVVVCNGDEEEISSIYRIWASSLETLSKESGITCSIAVGSAWSEAPVDLDNLIQIADNRMYVNKKAMKEKLGLEQIR